MGDFSNRLLQMKSINMHLKSEVLGHFRRIINAALTHNIIVSVYVNTKDAPKL